MVCILKKIRWRPNNRNNKKRQNIPKKCKSVTEIKHPFSIESKINEMKNDIKELKNTMKELLEMMKSVYEFEDA